MYSTPNVGWIQMNITHISKDKVEYLEIIEDHVSGLEPTYCSVT